MALQGGHFGHPGAAVIQGQQQGMVPTSTPTGAVGSGQERLDFCPREIPNQLLVRPFTRDGQHACHDGSMLGVAQGEEARQGADRRQTHIP
jgi:hypothetical protein